MSTPASPPLTARPWARVGLAARRLARGARLLVRALLHAGRRLLTRLLWLLRGWSGLIAGLLIALGLWLGPLAGARWIAVQATALYHHAAAAVTLWYQTAYDAVAWPAANGVVALRATQAWARHGYHGLAPAIHTSTWAFWMRHGAAWRYATLHSPSGAPVRAALPLELGGVLGFLALFAVFILIGRRKRALDPTRANTYGGSRWQTWDELRRRRARPGDMVLGTARRGLKRITVGVPAALLLEGVAIDAPTGLGKSNAFFKTQLLEPDPGVDYVATDNKGDGWTQTAAALSRTHDCYRLDMQNPANSVTWAPLALVRTPAKAEDWARAWLHNSKPTDSAPPQPYFEQAVLLLMAAGVMHVHAVAAAAGRPSGTLDELLALLLQPNVEAIEKALKNGPSGAETGPAAQFLGLIAEHRDLRSSIPSGLAPRLSALADPAIKAVVGGQGTLDLDRLGRVGRRPVLCENRALRGLAIIVVDEAAEDVMPLDRSRPRVVCQRHGTALVEPLMRSALIEESDVVGQDPCEVALVQDEQVIQALLARRPDPSLRHGVRVRSPVGGKDDLDVLGSEHGVKARGERRISVMDEEADRQRPVLDLPTEMPRLLRHPGRGRMLSAAGEVDASRPKLDEEEHVDRPQESRLNHEEVAGEQVLPMVTEEGTPCGGAGTLGCWRDAMALEDIADGRAAHRVGELAQLAMDTGVPPARVLLRQLEDQVFEIRVDARTPSCVVPARERPLAPDKVPVPAEDRVGADQDDGGAPPAVRVSRAGLEFDRQCGEE